MRTRTKPAARATAASRSLLAMAVAAHSLAQAGGGSSARRLSSASALESNTRADFGSAATASTCRRSSRGATRR